MAARPPGLGTLPADAEAPVSVVERIAARRRALHREGVQPAVTIGRP